jgi:hypothetical protein
MNTCETCKFWTQGFNLIGNPNQVKVPLVFGACSNPKLIADGYTNAKNRNCGIDEIVYPYDEGVHEFTTGKNFGCIHRELKK